MPTICELLGDQLAASPDRLDGQLCHHVKRAFVDWAAAALCGAEHPAARSLCDATREFSGTGHALVVVDGERRDPRTAALVNATAAHALEVDDIYRDGIYHPGAPTIAAALAVGQQRAISGLELVRAVAVGYEVGCRIAAAVQPSHYRYWHTTGTVGTFGAAAATSAALCLDAETSAHALALAATFAAGLQQSFRSEAFAKPLHAGHAADAGVLAAFAADKNVTGALDVLEGDAGFGAAMSAGVRWEDVVEPWNSPWAVEEITVKNHTACGHTFAPIDATLSLRAQLSDSASDPRRILVETARIPIEVAGNRDPRTEFEAKFSIAYCVAAALRLGSVRFDAFSEAMLCDAALRDLMGRVELVVDPAIDATFPKQRAARVTIETSDGSVVTEQAWTRRGDPDSPLSDDELSEKFVELASSMLAQRVGAVLESLWSIDQLKDVRELAFLER